ncbi:pyrroline-5-carboxylate dehydrogenase [Endozoicomonas montiporae]|uniref:Bifunctional protein PutA n=2 Tax=Endozoicomonas montiporae TaxID=1027273 RepID=A0A081N341_9GAMM|nr:bifunctional proline dehydrogenase/L-glutamate gamma-semialdehyde dehydrogenase PutA [Endozoicomonas montiporae]AMO58158.1 bifunctional proline dehydrogenase/pyrroline-5-carboxylate dehydrogenase [Endozoicomonas montiporae CL-33]KEQ12864.1 pyrroline-5-carboxylate dehydrogenase [Endozoicomonas montiporae]
MLKACDAFIPDIIASTPAQLWQHISPHYCIDESGWLAELLTEVQPTAQELRSVSQRATGLVDKVRERDDAIHMIDALLLQYSLDTREGILLMCLAEALMRIPDSETADALIKDKLSVADWNSHLSQSESLLVNASTWGLMLTGKVVSLDRNEDGSPTGVINRLVNKMGEPVIRQAVHQAMKIMGRHFVLGRTITEALKNGRKAMEQGYTYSFDMLGEAALTAKDAASYHAGYLSAINTVGKQSTQSKRPRPTISIKLSALHPRYEVSQKKRVMTELFSSVLELIKAARMLDVGITIDAEEQDRLELSLELFEKLYRHPECAGWGNFGLVVQAYGKRALPVLVWLAGLASEQGDQIPVRLVKGAYWDSEIKFSQQNGLDGYPVYTRKEATDVAYLACARFLLQDFVQPLLFPQFASHNAHTVAAILCMAGSKKTYEFQRLHGMGDALYNTVMQQELLNVRIYAPVGSHKDLLPYLVRRLLENGANSSFVHRLVDAKTPVEDLVHHPVERLQQYKILANDCIPLPEAVFGSERVNSRGTNIDIEHEWTTFSEGVLQHMTRQWKKGPVIGGQSLEAAAVTKVLSPYRQQEMVGAIHWAGSAEVDQALNKAVNAFDDWRCTDVSARSACLERLADLLEIHRDELVALCHREAGKTIHDAIDEIREAVDFCRYYAVQARKQFADPMVLTGPTGESNELYLTGRGVFVCISPWNFPLAIFLGQIVAALVAGNTVIAKPAEQTGLIAARATELMLEAGVPGEVVQLLPGDGATVGHRLVADSRIAGVAFTGSTDTAQRINQTLANREGAIVPLIAETGGMNTMLVDSTALPEQVVQDVIHSAFGSAGQRCSALRILYIQDDVADRVIQLLKGAMEELQVGDPSRHETDVGPVIDADALTGLESHVKRMKKEARLIAETPLSDGCEKGYFVAPVAFEIKSIAQLEREQFGPILHVIRYQSSELERILNEINDTGYGLTLGIHTRNEATAGYIEQRLRVGNTYINRNQIGAVVGVQPFGGQGLSGTGPKAGGPHYLYRFATERTRTINTTAVGGNATLLSLGDSH